MSPGAARFSISFDRAFGVLAWPLGMSRQRSFVELDEGQVKVTMGWPFLARFPASAVVATRPYDKTTLSRGVHGFAGRWLVNGSGKGIVVVDLEPVQRARMLGLPVKLRQLLVSVEDPDGLMAALAPR